MLFRYLLVQVVEDSYKINGLMTIVKDHQGSCFTLSIYNLVSDFNVVDATSFLPVGSILAIKEPYCKSTQGGGAMIRVDSPSDVIFIHQFDIFFEKLKVNEIRWSLRVYDAVHNGPLCISKMDWKNRGNDLFKRGNTLMLQELIQLV